MLIERCRLRQIITFPNSRWPVACLRWRREEATSITVCSDPPKTILVTGNFEGSGHLSTLKGGDGDS